MWRRNLHAAWLSQFLAIAGFGFVLPFVPFYIQELGVTDAEELRLWTGILAAAPALSMAIMAPIWGLLADRFGKKLMMLRAMFFGTIIMSLMATTRSVQAVLVLRICQGLFTGTITASAALVAGGTPKDKLSYAETKKAIREIIKIKEPYYVRLGRAKYPIITSDDTPFEFGKGIVFKEGNDVSLISTGTMIDFSLKAAEELAKNNISAEVIHLHTIKPIDEQLILATSVKTGAIVTIEEHSIIGGLGSAVSESVCANHPVPVERIGIQDKFGRSGTPSELIKAYNLDVPDICAAARKVINKKGS